MFSSQVILADANMPLPNHPVNAGGMVIDLFNPKGKFRVEHWRSGKLLATYDVDNGITNQGKNKILDTMFHSSTPIATASWFIGLIDNTGTPTLAAGDLLSSHAGWTEFTSYSGTRPVWGQGSASSQSMTNASPATFNISATGTLYGILVCSVTTGGTGTDILWSTAAFTATVPVANGDQMKVTYTLAT